MASNWHLSSFVAMLLLSTGISFLGYHYLGLANAYREANFHHLDEVYRAIDLLRQRPLPLREDVLVLSEHVQTSLEGALWCTENLTRFDRAVFEAFGAGDAFAICEEAVVNSEGALNLLVRLAQDESSVSSGFIIYNEVMHSLETLRDQSVTFEPHVTELEAKMERLVHIGTGAMSALLILLSAFVARKLQSAQREIELRSQSDSLTGLLNRRGLDRALSKRSNATRQTILVRIDLDRFKQVNDVMGHEAGDFVLCNVADIMRRTSHCDDALARVGGDEFVILCGPGRDEASAKALAEEILSAVMEPVLFDGKQCVYGASFGIATSEPFGLDHGELLNAADKALYDVKRTGRGAVAIYSEQMHVDAVRERALSDRLRTALANGEIVPYFQSQHHAKTGALFGVEVLARWQHPEDGLLTPDRFFEVVQQMGMENELDRTVFVQTIEIMDRLTAKGLVLPRVAFNVSAGRITDPGFVGEVCKSITKDRDRVAFEILETVSYEDSSEALSMTIDALRDLGFQIDVDDFGSGHASINSVLNIWPDILKIDRNLIRPIVENEQALRMAVSIIDLAQALDMQVIAEGVDSAEKAQLLSQVGCDVLQGYHYSRPMPADDLETLLRDMGTSTWLAS